MNTSVLPAPTTAPAPMSVFERYLTVWVFLCIVVGIALGQVLPGPVQAIVSPSSTTTPSWMTAVGVTTRPRR